MNKNLTIDEMNRSNIIGVKIVDEKRNYNQTLGSAQVKTIKRTQYLKICWFCGSPYESNKYNTYACSARCVQNLIYARKNGFNAPARMDKLTKEKNIRVIIDKYGYY
jgi:hypothetical protein